MKTNRDIPALQRDALRLPAPLRPVPEKPLFRRPEHSMNRGPFNRNTPFALQPLERNANKTMARPPRVPYNPHS